VAETEPKTLGLLFKTSTFKVLVDGPMIRFLKKEKVDPKILYESWSRVATELTKSTIFCTLGHALYNGIVAHLGEEPSYEHIAKFLMERYKQSKELVQEMIGNLPQF
jgi:hypothetical protein